MALTLNGRSSLSRLASSAAPLACRSALPRARALFVDARSIRRTLCSLELSNQPRSGVATQAVQVLKTAAADQLISFKPGRAEARSNSRHTQPSYEHRASVASHAAQASVAATSTADLLSFKADPTCSQVIRFSSSLGALLGTSRANPRRKGWMPPTDSLIHLTGCLRTAVQHFREGCRPDASNSHPRFYLGYCAELVGHAEQQPGGELTREDARRWLEKKDDEWAQANFGMSLKELLNRHIDHIQPEVKEGLNHPCNYYLMDPKKNSQYSGYIRWQKCMHVGFEVTCAVLLFHAKKLLLLTDAQLELLGDILPWVLQAQHQC